MKIDADYDNTTNSRYRKNIDKLKSVYCSRCPWNDIENLHGKHSEWGRKVAKRREYTTGKKRSVKWMQKHTWKRDKHFM